MNKRKKELAAVKKILTAHGYPIIDVLPIPISDSQGELINYGVARIFEALDDDIKTFPGGYEECAARLGIKKNTAYCLSNPRHESQMSVSNLVNFLAVNNATNIKAAFIEVADVLARYRQNEAKRKLEKLKSQIEALK